MKNTLNQFEQALHLNCHCGSPHTLVVLPDVRDEFDSPRADQPLEHSFWMWEDWCPFISWDKYFPFAHVSYHFWAHLWLALKGRFICGTDVNLAPEQARLLIAHIEEWVAPEPVPDDFDPSVKVLDLPLDKPEVIRFEVMCTGFMEENGMEPLLFAEVGTKPGTFWQRVSEFFWCFRGHWIGGAVELSTEDVWKLHRWLKYHYGPPAPGGAEGYGAKEEQL